MENNSEFIEQHLDRVSRSFAFCIRQLPEPLKRWVGVSYLLCRIVDTIEDSEFSSPDSQARAFDWFDRSITEGFSVDEGSSNYPKELWPQALTSGEAQLLEEAQRVFEIFWGMDEEARERVSKLAFSMSQGMRHFRMRSTEPLRLKDLKEVNQYCFFVAGLVGEMLAGFVSQVEPKFTMTVSRVLRAHHFGLFLQKVNLLKDQLKDQKLGRFLVPSRGELERSAHENATEALQFLTELPLEQVEFRRFCAWSLFMGVESLKVASKGFKSGVSKKLTRPKTDELLMQVEESLADNSKLRELFDQSSDGLGWAPRSVTASVNDLRKELEPSADRIVPVRIPEEKSPSWLFKIYKGHLEPQNMMALGIS
ncbi:squalene/phytoene synthase family protein [bacterium]|nr:squalene/phytoene synthase family protein [bacterium]